MRSNTTFSLDIKLKEEFLANTPYKKRSATIEKLIFDYLENKKELGQVHPKPNSKPPMAKKGISNVC